MNAVLMHSQHSPTSPTDLVAEANHRIANNLALLVGLVRMQTLSLKKRGELTTVEVHHLLDGVAARLHTISQLHHILSRASNEAVIEIGTRITPILVTVASDGRTPTVRAA